jgi:soluble lytic murein transglycosylase-like protein
MTSTPDIVRHARPVRRLVATAVAFGFVAIGLAGAVPGTAPGSLPPVPGISQPTVCFPTSAFAATNATAIRAAHAPTAGGADAASPTVGRSARALGAGAYSAMVRRIAQRYSVEWKLVMAILASESGGDPAAVSPAGAVGLMQLMPDTAKDLGVDPFDPEQNVEGAVRYLSTLLSTFGSVDLTLVAYNAGPSFAVRYRDGSVELGMETRAFLTRVGESLH